MGPAGPYRRAWRFTLDGRPAGSSTTTVTVLPPHVVHDGRAGTTGGFTKRVLYLDEDFLGTDAVGHAVDTPTLRDGRLRHALASVHATLRQPGDELHATWRGPSRPRSPSRPIGT